ncbi:MAG: hypothetical protein Q4E75_03085 [bacterium]|nr:hypothetical protein [bacterium]
MTTIYNLVMSNIYLYLCILIVLIIFITILFIVISNQKNRKKIKDDLIEAERIDKELESNEITESGSELQNILKHMQEEMDVKPEDVVKKFEEEQEEKAIISYQELVNNVKAGKIEVVDDDNCDVDFVEKLNVENYEEPILDSEESSVTPEMVKDAISSISLSSNKVESKKFKKSEFISPIYGVVENKFEYPTVKKNENIMDLMNTRDYNKLTEEINRQEEFLKALKEFRNNL